MLVCEHKEHQGLAHATTSTAVPLEPSHRETCLGLTCLKWTEDGKLSELDHLLILERLCLADEQICGALAEHPAR
jgi:hypothetical protein